MELKTIGLTKKFSSKTAVDNLNITLTNGVYGLLGANGAGKTTHITFLASCLRAMGHEVICLREPGGTSVGEDLRAIVLDPKNAGLCAESELLIYEAARAQIIREVIIPALARGSGIARSFLRFDHRLPGVRSRPSDVIRASSEQLRLPGGASLSHDPAHHGCLC